MTSSDTTSTAPMVCLAKDIPGAEGPLVDNQGRYFMVSPGKGRILEVKPDGSTRDLVQYDGVPAGTQLAPEGDIWVADMKRGVMRATPDGQIHEECVTFEGQPMRGCNDCAFDSKGNLYFTAPAGSNDKAPIGEVYCRLASGEVRKLDDGYQFCNGLAVTTDDATLIVAETFTKKLWAFDIRSPGVVGNKREWGVLPGDHRGGPDGVDFDDQGHLLAANWGGSAIEIFDPSGKHVGRIVTPFAKPSNIHFCGPGSRDILITEHNTNGLWKTTHRTAGQKQYGWR